MSALEDIYKVINESPLNIEDILWVGSAYGTHAASWEEALPLLQRQQTKYLAHDFVIVFKTGSWIALDWSYDETNCPYGDPYLELYMAPTLIDNPHKITKVSSRYAKFITDMKHADWG